MTQQEPFTQEQADRVESKLQAFFNELPADEQQLLTAVRGAEGLTAKMVAFCNSLSPDEQALLAGMAGRKSQEVSGYGQTKGMPSNFADIYYLMTTKKPFGQKADGTPWKM